MLNERLIMRKNVLHFLIGFVASEAMYAVFVRAQTLTPATAQTTDWTEIAIIGGIVLLAVGAFILHKRFPSASEKAAATIHADAMAMGHKALDLLHKHADAKPSPTAGITDPNKAEPSIHSNKLPWEK